MHKAVTRRFEAKSYSLIEGNRTIRCLKPLKYVNRAVASLTVPGGQEFHFPQILINFSYFSSNFSHFLPHFGPPGGRVALSTPLYVNCEPHADILTNDPEIIAVSSLSLLAVQETKVSSLIFHFRSCNSSFVLILHRVDDLPLLNGFASPLPGTTFVSNFFLNKRILKKETENKLREFPYFIQITIISLNREVVFC